MITTQTPAAVRVACADDGSPRRLIWGGRRLTVIQKPIPWIGRRSWWELTRRAERGTTAAIFERDMWHVEARDVDTGEVLTLDLAVEEHGWEVADEHL